MFAGSVVLGLTLIGFAAWLHLNELRGWPSESGDDALDQQYLRRRVKSRGRIHMIIAGCGVLAIVAAFARSATPLWVAAWTSIMLALVTVVLLALLDAFRTHRYHARKLPEIRRQHLGEDL